MKCDLEPYQNLGLGSRFLYEGIYYFKVSKELCTPLDQSPITCVQFAKDTVVQRDSIYDFHDKGDDHEFPHYLKAPIKSCFQIEFKSKECSFWEFFYRVSEDRYYHMEQFNLYTKVEFEEFLKLNQDTYTLRFCARYSI
jgi:hypothetical protein